MARPKQHERYPPEKKAKVVFDLLQGMGIREAAEKHGVAKSTVGDWALEIRGQENMTPPEYRRSRYEQALEGFAVAALEMLKCQAELLSNPDYIRSKETDDVVKHTEFVQNQLYRFIEQQRALPAQPMAQPALPEPAEEFEDVSELVA